MGLARISIVAFVFVFFFACSSSKVHSGKGGEKIDEINFRVVSAEMVSWKGAIDGTTGDRLTIKLTGNKIKEVIPDSVWYDQYKGFRSSYTANGDTLILKGSYSASDKVKLVDLESGNKTDGSVKVKAPHEYQGEALVRFYLSGQPKFVVVEKFRKIKQ
jgi:hypothetical protein